jgi:hypothetical protein
MSERASRAKNAVGDRGFRGAGALLLGALAACAPTLTANQDRDASADAARPVGDAGVTTLVVDATSTTEWRYLDLETGTFVTSDVPSPSTTWDLSFQRFKILSNGGVTGPGGVAVARLHDTDFDTLTRAPEGGYLIDVVDGDDDDDAPDSAFVNGVDDWYEYDEATHLLTPTSGLVYVVRTADDGYFKLRVSGYYDAVGTPALVTVEWAPIDPPSSVMLPDGGPPVDGGPDAGPGDSGVVVPGDALTIDASATGAWTYLDLETASTLPVLDPAADARWDVAFSRTWIRTSSGTSSTQRGGARFLVDATYDEVVDTGTLGFVEDELVDDGRPGSTPTSLNPLLADWYDYDFSTHTVSATPGVYVVRSSEGAYFRLRIWDWVDGVFRVSIAPIAVTPETVEIAVDVSASGSRVYLDLHAGSAIEVTSPLTDPRWDLALTGLFLSTSSGTSGSGAGGAVDLATEDFDAVASAPVDGYAIDTLLTDPSPGGGTHSASAPLSAWYDYDPVTHTVSPRQTTFAVALADGSVGKLAITGYAAGTFTLRWAYAGPHRTAL